MFADAHHLDSTRHHHQGSVRLSRKRASKRSRYQEVGQKDVDCSMGADEKRQEC